MQSEKGLRELDRRYLWHPLMQPRELEQHPPSIMMRAEGCLIIDDQGKEYVDGLAGLWCVGVGYGRKEIADAVYQQMMDIPYYPMLQTVAPAARLAEKLASILPGSVNRVFFINSGSEAVETAIKMARQYCRQQHPRDNKFKIISRYRAYHGFTYGGLSATGLQARKHHFEPAVPGFLHACAPYCFRCDFGKTYPDCALECAKHIETIIINENPRTIAAVIAEPIQGGGGVIVPPDEYIPMVREICDRHGILLIIDEVITGFCRTGELFASILYGIVPDIMTMAKQISSGYIPLAATAAKDEIYEGFLGTLEDDVAFSSISTFGGHAAACAAGLANLEIMLRERLWENVREVGPYLLSLLKPLEKLKIVGEVRGKGLLAAIELVGENKVPAPARLVWRVYEMCKKEGVLIGPFGHIIGLAPPLVVTRAEIEKIVAALEKTLTIVNRERK